MSRRNNIENCNTAVIIFCGSALTTLSFKIFLKFKVNNKQYSDVTLSNKILFQLSDNFCLALNIPYSKWENVFCGGINHLTYLISSLSIKLVVIR